MKRVLLTLALVLGMLLGTASPASSLAGRPSPATQWIQLELDAIASHRVNPPRAARGLALVSQAMYLAALAREGGRDDAVAGAASTVLLHLFPDEAARIEALVRETASGDDRALRSDA